MAFEFQFHLVRLKAYLWLSIQLGIPRFQFHLVRLKDKDKIQSCMKTLFQFHLVRLKEIKNTFE